MPRELAKQDPADAALGTVRPIARRDHEAGRAIGGQRAATQGGFMRPIGQL
jgi:hypothetical protein